MTLKICLKWFEPTKLAHLSIEPHVNPKVGTSKLSNPFKPRQSFGGSAAQPHDHEGHAPQPTLDVQDIEESNIS